jgi:hypothetical protein
MKTRNNDPGTGGPTLLLAAVAADQDLFALFPPFVAGVVSQTKCRLPRRIKVYGAGNLVYEEEWSVASGSGVTTTLPVAITPDVIDAGEIRHIKAATTATNILVQW